MNKNVKLLLYVILAPLILFLLVKLSIRIYKYIDLRNMPRFELYKTNGELINNLKYERREQILLYKYLDENDIVLQLGGNIGTSCILADKLLNKKDKQLCVEPNPEVIDVLEKNKAYNKSQFRIIEGIVTDKNYSYVVKYEDNDTNKWGTMYVRSAENTNEDSGDIRFFDYYLLEQMINDKINVLFFDCEGCACDFFETYENVLPDIDKIVLEQDQEEICNYKTKVIPILQKYNFLLKKDGMHQVWIKE